MYYARPLFPEHHAFTAQLLIQWSPASKRCIVGVKVADADNGDLIAFECSPNVAVDRLREHSIEQLRRLRLVIEELNDPFATGDVIPE